MACLCFASLASWGFLVYEEQIVEGLSTQLCPCFSTVLIVVGKLEY